MVRKWYLFLVEKAVTTLKYLKHFSRQQRGDADDLRTKNRKAWRTIAVVLSSCKKHETN
jgi:hypothetical protein